MKQLTLFFSLIILLFVLLIGCSNDIIDHQITEDEYLKQQVLESDEIADFLASTDATIDDEYEKGFDYDDYGFFKTTEPITPLKWGRKIENINRTLMVNREDDSVRVVQITKEITGKLIVKAIKDNGGIFDTVRIEKQFTQTTNRRIRFARVDRDNDVRRNWKPVALTLVEGKTGNKNFDIVKLEVFTEDDTTEITNPLTYWLRFAHCRGGVVYTSPGATIRVRLTIHSTNDSAEYALLRHSTEHRHRHRVRTRMQCIQTAGDPGNYTRVYEKTFTSRLPMGLALGRYNAVVDILSFNSLNDDTEPYMNMFWGMPYIAKRF